MLPLKEGLGVIGDCCCSWDFCQPRVPGSLSEDVGLASVWIENGEESERGMGFTCWFEERRLMPNKMDEQFRRVGR